MNRVYLFLADGFEVVEGLTVVDMLRRADIDITTVSITGRKEVKSSHNVIIMADELFGDSDYQDADMLILPGGMPGTVNLMNFNPLAQLLKQFNEQNKMLAAICAAPGVLGVNGVLKGKKAVCYPGHEEKLQDAVFTNEGVVKDKNVITGRGMGSAIDFSLEIIRYFGGEEKAEAIAKAIQYQV